MKHNLNSGSTDNSRLVNQIVDKIRETTHPKKPKTGQEAIADLELNLEAEIAKVRGKLFQYFFRFLKKVFCVF